MGDITCTCTYIRSAGHHNVDSPGSFSKVLVTFDSVVGSGIAASMHDNMLADKRDYVYQCSYVLSLCISVDCGKRNVKNVALMKLTSNQLLEEDHLEQLLVILGNL